MKRKGEEQFRQHAQWICWRWPSPNGSASGGCKFETPWIFRTLENVGAHLLRQFEQQQRPRWEIQGSGLRGLQRVSRAPLSLSRALNLLPTATISESGNAKSAIPPVQGFFLHIEGILANLGRRRAKAKSSSVTSSQEGLGDLEQRALAQALARRKPATIIEFYSPKCTLCRSLVPVVEAVESKHEQWLHIIMADIENKRWLPEVLHYDINYVPCFLLLDSCGNALAKTGVPYSRNHVLQGLAYLLESMKPIKPRVRYLPPEADTSAPS